MIANSLYMSVESGCLSIREGRGAETDQPGLRSIRISRPQTAGLNGFKRLVLVGGLGMLTLPSLRWLQDCGIALTHVDSLGRLGVVAAPLSYDDARLRRAQAVAIYAPGGLEIVRYLIGEKLRGQTQVIRTHSELENAELAPYLAQVENADSIGLLRNLESRAAQRYWAAWRGVSVRFTRRDLARVPEHWQLFGSRTSALSKTPRAAVSPGNAILNLLYALGESESRLACLAVGLDPGIGLGLHEDEKGRQSAALDLLEAARPTADAMLLKSLKGHVFERRDFQEIPDGSCRLSPALAASLPALTIPVFRRVLAPVAENVAARLPAVLEIMERGRLVYEQAVPGLPSKPASMGTLPGLPENPPIRTPLTQGRRYQGRWQKAAPELPAPKALKLPRVCLVCGQPLPKATRTKSAPRVYCSDCWPQANSDLGAQVAARSMALRAEGHDPSRGGEAGKLRAEAMRRRHQLDREWDLKHAARPDAELFRVTILPLLGSVGPTALSRATGLSVGHCSRIRKGEITPHPRHWKALRSLAVAD